MKIVQVIGAIETEAAGPSYSVPRLAGTLCAAGHECSLMTVGTPASSVNLGAPQVTFKPTKGFPAALSKLRASSDLRRALLDEGRTSDVFHTHGLWTMPNLYPLNVGRKTHTVTVVSPRGMLSPDALEYSRLTKRLFGILFQNKALGGASMIHVTSEKEHEDARAFGLSQPIAVIPNGIDLPDIRNFGKKRLCGPQSILFLGRLHPIKRLENLISAWAEIEAISDKWTLEIRGPGSRQYRTSLEHYAKTLGVQRCVFGDAVYGHDKFAAFRAASVTVLPSASENFGMTVAESLSSGTPVITTKGTPWSGLRDRDCGWWVDHGKEGLTTALREAMSYSPSQLEEMGMRGRNWMNDSFSWEAVCSDMLDAYSWLQGSSEKPDFIQL